MEKFIMNTRIFMGHRCCEEIRNFDMRRAYVICDPFMQESGKTELVTETLREMNVPYDIFARVVPDPDMEVVKDCLNAIVNFRPDTVFAMGGGSAIDTAKAVVKLYAQYCGVELPRLVALPTTSGTGSEVTAFAVITDKAAGVKYPLVDDDLTPDVVFLDPLLTETVPPKITADTGMDVLTHAIEAFVSTNANDFTDAFAEKSIRTVFDFLERCVTDGSDLNARAHMHNASCMAGAAFNVASLGICHSMAHQLGEQFHIPHGRCCAMFLPLSIEYNAGLELPGEGDSLLQYLDIARVIGVSAGTNKATIHLLVRNIRALMDRIGIPGNLEELGIDRDEYMAAIDRMTENALKDRCLKTNPRVPSAEDIRSLYRRLAQL